MMLNKKGNASDLIFLSSVAFIFLFLFLLITAYIAFTIFNSLGSVPAISEVPEAAAVLTAGGSFYNNMDKVAVAFFVSSLLGLIITSWFVSGHLIAMIAYFLVGVMSILISMFISNFWEYIAEAAPFASTLALFPFANHVMTYFPFYMGAFFVIGLAITFIKPSIQGPQQEFNGGALP